MTQLEFTFKYAKLPELYQQINDCVATAYEHALVSKKPHEGRLKWVANTTSRSVDDVRQLVLDAGLPEYFNNRCSVSLSDEQKNAAVRWTRTSLTPREAGYFTGMDTKTIDCLRFFLELPLVRRDFSLVDACRIYSVIDKNPEYVSIPVARVDQVKFALEKRSEGKDFYYKIGDEYVLAKSYNGLFTAAFNAISDSKNPSPQAILKKMPRVHAILVRRATIEPMLLENLRQLYGVSAEEMETPRKIELPRVA
jgi:hypothetical protein